MKEFFARKCAHTKRRNVIESIRVGFQKPYSKLE
jgi:hypothetical protein